MFDSLKMLTVSTKKKRLKVFVLVTVRTWKTKSMRIKVCFVEEIVTALFMRDCVSKIAYRHFSRLSVWS